MRVLRSIPEGVNLSYCRRAHDNELNLIPLFDEKKFISIRKFLRWRDCRATDAMPLLDERSFQHTCISLAFRWPNVIFGKS